VHDIPVLGKYSLVVHFENNGAKDLVEVIVLCYRGTVGAANEHKEESRVLKGLDHHGEGRGGCVLRVQSMIPVDEICQEI
jgi:hypothetical protein